MTKRKLRKYTVYLINLLVLLPWAYQSKACVWMESPETYRISMFSVITPRMASYSPFFYSAERFNDYLVDPEHNDRNRNCKEWIDLLGGNIKLSDAYVIIYNTNPDLFIGAVHHKSLKTDFEKNQFVEELLKPQNKSFLDYLLISKRIENWDFLISESWGEDQKSKVVDPNKLVSELISECETKLKIETNPNIKFRYAFQLVRLYQRTDADDKCIAMVDKYFSNYSASILGIWAQMHKGIVLNRKGNKVQANYLLSISFAQCDEKKLRSLQLFENDTKSVNETYRLAKNNQERANIIAMSILQNPGQTMDRMRAVFNLDQKNEMIPLLLMREVNKLEDWIGTSKFTYNLPFPRTTGEYYTHEDSVRVANLEHDKLYLKKIIAMLDSMKNQVSPDNKAYFSIALAHLSFLGDQPVLASRYLAEIKDNAPASVLAQKYVDEILEASSKMKLTDVNFHDFLADRLMKLESKDPKNKMINRTLYSLTRYFGTQYSQNQDQAMAGLLVMKSNQYKSKIGNDNESEYVNNNYYQAINYFDNYAQLIDMDKLVSMIKKPNTKLETYLCKGFTPEKYIELSGTMAFRENKMDLAYTYFKQLPNDYWQKNYEFKNCLNEDPFVPKALTAKSKRKFTYHFNKTEFVGKLLDLKKEAEANTSKSGEASLQLAKALYNCTYYGNAWMMNFYGWTVYPGNPFTFSQDFGNQKIKEEVSKNYYQCDLASKYYRMALEKSKNEETKAEAALMLHRCDLNKYLFKDSQKADYYSYSENRINPVDTYTPIFLKEFSLYKKTKFYADIASNCVEVKNFLAREK